MTLFMERLLELLLRQKGTPLTPDKIRYALSAVHTIHFKERESKKAGKMQSKLDDDAEIIFNVLKIPTQRETSIDPDCCA